MPLKAANNSHLHEVIFADRHYINKLPQLKDFIHFLEHSPRLPNQNFFMLIRPRGFGISLTNEAIESLLSREEMLLDHMQNNPSQHLELDDLGSYAILHLSFSNPKANNLAGFVQILQETIQKQCWEHHTKNKDILAMASDLRKQMLFLLKSIGDNSKQQVVILVDNYDVPIYAARNLSSKIDQQKALAIYFDMLSAFRQAGDLIKFCLLAGHTKFALSSPISEGLPHIVDLSFHKIAATLLGFTSEEIRTSYAEDLARIAPQLGVTSAEYIDALEHCYGGFVFSDDMQKVLCPYSIARVLDNEGELYAYACDNQYTFLQSALDEAEPDLNWLFDKDGQDPLFLEEVDLFPKGKEFGSLLLQLGFVSVNKVTQSQSEHAISWLYRFGFTNIEMRRAFNILTKKARPELRELAINPRIYHAGEELYEIHDDKDSSH